MNTTMTMTMTMTTAVTPGFLQTLSSPRGAAARPQNQAKRSQRPPAIWPVAKGEPALWQLSMEATRDSLAERVLFAAVAILSFGSLTWLGMVTWQFLLAWQGMADGVRALLT
jgi:hypothetical protein